SVQDDMIPPHLSHRNTNHMSSIQDTAGISAQLAQGLGRMVNKLTMPRPTLVPMLLSVIRSWCHARRRRPDDAWRQAPDTLWELHDRPAARWHPIRRVRVDGCASAADPFGEITEHRWAPQARGRTPPRPTRGRAAGVGDRAAPATFGL